MHDTGGFDDLKKRIRWTIEASLVEAFARFPCDKVREAAEYATLGGGHRWRALVAVAAGRIFHSDPLYVVLPSACAIELAQAATLILDDLPSMDDATLRRGKPCAHLVFPGWAIDMAPVFLLSLAYEISLANVATTADRRAWAAIEMSRGGLTMIAGQAIDVTRGGRQVAETDLIHLARLKAGAFYGASAMVGAILCGANTSEAEAIRSAGESLGLAYQMLDDVADVTATVEEIGKDPGLDEGKFTTVKRLGVDGARRKATEFQATALARIEEFGREADFLRSLITEASWKAS